jgi:fatty acid-binding protein DegV
MVAIDEKTAEMIKKKVKELYDFKEVYVTAAGCTITSHCGKGTFGLLFLNK